MSYTTEMDMEAAEIERAHHAAKALERLVMYDEPEKPRPTQTRLGHERTVCQCRDCARFCDHMPGMMIPEDIDALAPPDMPNRLDWIATHLVASPGAIVGRYLEDGTIERLRIPTIRPATRAGGVCVFLDENGDCSIHDHSPYGCAVFDDHQTRTEGDRRSSDGLKAIIEDTRQDGPYTKLWDWLVKIGARAEQAPELSREITG